MRQPQLCSEGLWTPSRLACSSSQALFFQLLLYLPEVPPSCGAHYMNSSVAKGPRVPSRRQTDAGSKLSLLIPAGFQLVLACPTWQSAYRLAALLTCSVFRPPHDAEPTVSSPNPTIKQGLISGVLILCHSVILLLWANPNSSNHMGEHFTTWKHISFNDFLYLSRQAWNVRRRINLVLWSLVNLWRDIKKPSGKTILWLSKDDKNAFCRIQQHLLLIKNSWERRNGGVLP